MVLFPFMVTNINSGIIIGICGQKKEKGTQAFSIQLEIPLVTKKKKNMLSNKSGVLKA